MSLRSLLAASVLLTLTACGGGERVYYGEDAGAGADSGGSGSADTGADAAPDTPVDASTEVGGGPGIECLRDADCAEGFRCQDGACVDPQATVCVPGESRCDAGAIVTCADDGLTETETPCGADTICIEGDDGASCSPVGACEDGATGCVDLRTRFECVEGERVTTRCDNGELCESGECRSAVGLDPCVTVEGEPPLNIGSAAVGGTAFSTITIGVCDTLSPPATVTRARVEAPFFIANAGEFPAQVSPAADFGVRVGIRPVAGGRVEGKLTLDIADADDPIFVDIFGEGRTGIPDGGAAFSVELTWDSAGDLDLHLVHPEGTWNDPQWDCYYSNPTPDWGRAADTTDDPGLDQDIREGFGPENIVLDESEPGLRYQIGVIANGTPERGTSARVRVADGSGDVVFELSLRMEADTFWVPAAIVIGDDGALTVEEVNDTYDGFP